MGNNGTIQGVGDVIGVGVPKNRPIFYFDVPTALQRYGVKRIGIVELTATEELMAAKRAGMNVMQLGLELSKECLRSIDGKMVSLSDGSADVAFNALHPKLRTLLTTAYGHIHNPDSDDTKLFLESMEMSVG